MKLVPLFMVAAQLSVGCGEATAADICEFSLFRVPESGLGTGSPLPEPGGMADGDLSVGSKFEDSTGSIARRFGKLDTLVADNHRYCTAQVVGARNILLTAAHCVQDTGNAKWVSDFQLRPLSSPAARPVTDPKCIVTSRQWTKRPEDFTGRFFWPADYALIVLKTDFSDAVFNMGSAVKSPVTIYGLPVGLGRHEKLVAIEAVLESDPAQVGQGVVMHHQPDVGLGVSGGGWIVAPASVNSTATVVGLSTTGGQDGQIFGQIGPLFDRCAAEMMNFVQANCGS